MARFVVEKHTNDPRFCHRVRDTETGETYGFGLLLHDAVGLADQLTEATP